MNAIQDGYLFTLDQGMWTVNNIQNEVQRYKKCRKAILWLKVLFLWYWSYLVIIILHFFHQVVAIDFL